MSYAKTVIHELIHAYFYYRTIDAFGNATKTQKLEEELGWLKPYNPNAPLTNIAKAQHDQMTVFWVDKIVNGLKAYQVISESDLANIRTLYPNITLDEYYQAIAWGGLSVGSDGLSITNAWETQRENDPPKAAMYQKIQFYEQSGSVFAASKTKCN